MNDLIRWNLNDRIATITMDDGKANALNLAMIGELDAALDRAEAEAAVVVLAGRERMFSGGFDLRVFQGEPQDLLDMLEAGAKLAERLLAFPRPVVAVCSGHAIAMGAFLLLSTDVRIGIDEGARLHINEVRVGLTLPHFVIELCRQRLTPAALRHAILSGDPYGPHEARAAGFLDFVVPTASLATEAQRRALALVDVNAEAFMNTKQRLQSEGLARLRAAIAADRIAWHEWVSDASRG